MKTQLSAIVESLRCPIQASLTNGSLFMIDIHVGFFNCFFHDIILTKEGVQSYKRQNRKNSPSHLHVGHLTVNLPRCLIDRKIISLY